MKMLLEKPFSFSGRREIYRIYTTHTMRSIALSFVSVYVPIFFLSRGYSLSQVIGYYMVFHLSGLFFALFVIPQCIERFGILRTFKVNYIFSIAYYGFFIFFDAFSSPIWVIAVIGGASTFFYWIPLNIFLLKHADFDKMGSDMANFFALPKIFGIVGPLLSALLMYCFGFLPSFAIAIALLLLSYFPLAGMETSAIRTVFRFRSACQEFWRRKFLFFLEGFDNIIEEAEWFWGIYVYLLVGSIATPGIVGSLESIGVALFTLFVGKRANKNARKIVLFTASGIILLSFLRLFALDQIMAYGLSVIGAFILTAFLTAYFSSIYRSVQGKNEEEFIILREIPTVLGRMVVFGTILLTVAHPNFFFVLPIIATIILLLSFLARMRSVGHTLNI